MPGPHAADEIALTELAARELHVSIGDHLRASTFDATDLGALGSGKFPGFHGPPLDLRVVGVGAHTRRASGHGRARQPVRLRRARLRGRPSRVWPRGRQRWRSGCATVPRIWPGSSMLPISSAGGPGRLVVDSAGQEYQTSTQKALDALTSALVVFALVAGAAGAVLVAQTVESPDRIGGRVEPRAAQPRVDPLVRARWLCAVPAVGASVVGVVIGVGLAVVASPLLPIGLAPAGRDPSRRLGRSAGPGYRCAGGVAGRGRMDGAIGLAQPARSDRTSGSASSLGGRRTCWPRWGAGLQVVTGTRLRVRERRPAVHPGAVGAGRGRDRDGRRDRRRCGGRQPRLAGGPADPLGLGLVDHARSRWVSRTRRARLVADPDVAAVGGLNEVNVSMQGHVIDGFAMQRLKGRVGFTVLSGRLPAGPAEVALGTQSMADLRTSIGRTVHAVGHDGHTRGRPTGGGHRGPTAGAG